MEKRKAVAREVMQAGKDGVVRKEEQWNRKRRRCSGR
jgi:hypothetical protein